MPVQLGTNCFVSNEEAEEYFVGRIDAAAWDTADPTQKDKALVTATRILNELSWAGYAASSNQVLAFPRICSFFEPLMGFTVEAVDIPRRIKEATCELAYHLLNNDGLLDETGSVSELAVGPVQLNSVKAAKTIPKVVAVKIRPLLSNNVNQVWRAN